MLLPVSYWAYHKRFLENQELPSTSKHELEEKLVISVPINRIRQSSKNEYTVIPCAGYFGSSKKPTRFVFASGELAQLRNSLGDRGNELKRFDLLQYLSDLIPKTGRQIGIVTYQNGIMNTPDDFHTMGNLILKNFPEKPLCIGIYNRKLSFFSHVKRLKKLYWDEEVTAVVDRTYIFFKILMRLLMNINPNILWLHIMHSEGAAIGNLALQQLEKRNEIAPFKKHLITACYGPVMQIPERLALDTFNTYSDRDTATEFFIPNTRGGYQYKTEIIETEFAGQYGYTHDYRNDSWEKELSRPMTYVTPAVSMLAKLATPDHAFAGKTYQTALRKNMIEIRKKYGVGH